MLTLLSVFFAIFCLDMAFGLAISRGGFTPIRLTLLVIASASVGFLAFVIGGFQLLDGALVTPVVLLILVYVWVLVRRNRGRHVER